MVQALSDSFVTNWTIPLADQFSMGWRAEDNVSAPSSFIANARNELYAFYTGKCGLLKKIWANRGAPSLLPPPFNPPLDNTWGCSRR